LKHHCAAAQIILVGTKADLRDEAVANKDSKVATAAQAEATRKKIGAVAYMESTAKKNQGVSEIFDKAIRITIDPPEKRNNKQTCSLL